MFGKRESLGENSDMIALLSAIIILLLTIPVYFYLNRNSDYWKIRNVPYIPPFPILGNLKSLIFFEKSPGKFLADLHNAPEAIDQRFLGIFIFNNEPALLIRDPELIKNILVKDFEHFGNRNVGCDEKSDPVGYNNIFTIRGPKWKYIRNKVSPTFTSAKIKVLFHLIKEKTNDLLQLLDNKIGKDNGKSSAVLEVKDILTRFTIDVISTCGFGIQSNSISNENSHFLHFGSKIFKMTFIRSLEVRAFFFMHWIAKTFKFAFLQKESSQFFREVFWETLNEREKSQIVRNDFVDTLLKIKHDQRENLEKNGGVVNDEIFEFDGDLLAAQPVFFFTAGFESSATTASFALYELALQPHIQDRLRKEIADHLKAHDGELTYDGLFEMKFLDMVVSETLRKYPPMPFIDRRCTIEYKIPDSDIVIPKGMPVFMSLFQGLHYNEDYFPMPEKFDPERFSDENKSQIHSYTYIPFGEGPRMCLARRFGLMNVKAALSKILSNYTVEICESSEIPLELDSRSLVITAKNGYNLKFVKI